MFSAAVLRSDCTEGAVMRSFGKGGEPITVLSTALTDAFKGEEASGGVCAFLRACFIKFAEVQRAPA
ncbi:hypothetical protein PBY51_011323 [Eleginops maclovinus]|uniref:Uncharacterized protein n=1 Tax=Eleginops maclovinus TaxID=56733 RepID=A0AAN7XU00_ELEMC|nr:hypothetical protein PBY51_011323 [Eleginops maclovinus]